LDKIRTFISLNIEESLKEKLKLIQSDVKDSLKNYPVKWTNSGNFHLTLRFLGNLEESLVNQLTKELSEIKPGFGKLKFNTLGIGFFPNPEYPNVVFIDLKEDGNNSGKLVEKIDSVINSYGIKPDKKFVPHITLGRFKHEARKKLTYHVNVKFENFELEFQSFFLMKSILKSNGPEYEVIKEFKLQ